MRKAGKVDEKTSKYFADIVIYLTQPAMIIYSFLDVKFSTEIVTTALFVFVVSMLLHFGYYGLSKLLFNKSPEKQRYILKYSVIFTNAGFMGIPLISELFGSEAAIYATFYVVSFNVFNWSLGCFIYTKDKSYMAPKKMFLNPATIPTYIGLFFFVLGGFVTIPEALTPAWSGFIVPIVKDNILFLLKSTVIPLSMMMIGIRLAESNFKSMFLDKNIIWLVFIRLLAIPVCVAFILKGVSMLGVLPADLVTDGSAVLVISSSTPVAAMATIFAERYDGDAVFSSRIVSATTLISLITMPLIAMLLLAVNI
jgi:predicted permease